MFADQVRIFVAGGSGGDGSASFRREAHVPRGGPDGGDGGSGGAVVLVVDAGMTTLGDLRHHPHHRAKPGGPGAGRKAHGANAKDVLLPVPPGTVAREVPTDGAAGDPEGMRLIGELMAPGERLVVARGGRGGRGNVHFVSSTHQAPRHAQKGEPGESRWIELELKLIADIGLVGAPNAGKSTLLAALTAATPEVGDYPFTTTRPNLGVIELDEERRAVIADLPGLIEGASEGAGLGHLFLRHLQRTRLLLHIVDFAPFDGADPVAQAKAIVGELKKYDAALYEKPRWLVLNKLDMVPADEREARVKDFVKRFRHKGPVYEISALTREGCEGLIKDIYKHIKSQQVAEQPATYIDPRFSGEAAE